MRVGRLLPAAHAATLLLVHLVCPPSDSSRSRLAAKLQGLQVASPSSSRNSLQLRASHPASVPGACLALVVVLLQTSAGSQHLVLRVLLLVSQRPAQDLMLPGATWQPSLLLPQQASAWQCSSPLLHSRRAASRPLLVPRQSPSSSKKQQQAQGEQQAADASQGLVQQQPHRQPRQGPRLLLQPMHQQGLHPLRPRVASRRPPQASRGSRISSPARPAKAPSVIWLSRSPKAVTRSHQRRPRAHPPPRPAPHLALALLLLLVVLVEVRQSAAKMVALLPLHQPQHQTHQHHQRLQLQQQQQVPHLVLLWPVVLLVQALLVAVLRL